MTRSIPLAALVCAALTLPAFAQERPSRLAEQARLEKLLAEVDAALAALRKSNSPPQRWAEYDLRSLLRQAPDRHAPRLTLPTPNAGTQTAAGGGAGGGSFTFSDEDESDGYGLSPDEVVELVGEAFLPEHPEPSFRIEGGFLHLRGTEANHAIAKQVLAKLGRDRLRCVQVEVGIYALPEALQARLEKAALEGSGMLRPQDLKTLDQAVARGEGKLVDAAILSSLNQQSVYFHRGLERSYVASLERSSGGTGQVVQTVTDPVIDVITTGLALEVRPTLMRGGERIQLDLRCMRADLQGMARRTTPYGSVDVPRLAVSSARTSARVPVGAGVMISAARTAVEDKDAAGAKKGQSVLIVVRPR